MSKSEKIKKAIQAKRKEYDTQTITLNDEWSIVRLDDYNWQIRQKGNKRPWDRWFYSSVKQALYGIFEKALNEQPHKWLHDLVPLAERIEQAILRLEEQKSA